LPLALESASESVSLQNSMKPLRRLQQRKINENRNVQSCFGNLETPNLAGAIVVFSELLAS
jgi:hypothetical protein